MIPDRKELNLTWFGVPNGVRSNLLGCVIPDLPLAYDLNDSCHVMRALPEGANNK